MTRTTRIFAPAALVALAGALAAPALANPLAGPAVDSASAPASLVERNIDGSMRRPDAPLAEAALKVIDLDASTKAKVDALLAARAKQIDGIVRANMSELNQLRTDRAASKGERGEQSGRREHMRTMMTMFKPVLEKGPLEKQIAALMPEATGAAYLTHIEEHRATRAAERRARGPEGGPEGRPERGRRGGPGGPPPGAGPDDGPMLFEDPMLDMIEGAPPADGGDRERRRAREGDRGAERGGARGAMFAQLGDLQMEIRRSFERLQGAKEARQSDLAEQLGLSPEQAQQVEAIMRKARTAGRESDDPRAARRAAMQELAEVLTPEQLEKLRGMRQGRGGEARGPRRGPRGQQTD